MRTLLVTLSAAAMLITSFASAWQEQPGGSPGQAEPVYKEDWEMRRGGGELEPYDTGLLGDSIDPHTGSISFSTADVVLPGNNGLEVAIRRRRLNQDADQRAELYEFADWSLDVPRIMTSSIEGWEGNRCSASFIDTFPRFLWTSQAVLSDPSTVTWHSMSRDRYSSGVKVELPGFRSMQMLDKYLETDGSYFWPNYQWPAGSQKATASGMWFSCLSDVEGGGEGFVGHDPSGTTYYFDRVIRREGGTLGTWPNAAGHFVEDTSIVATRVVDRHGNEVNYTWDGLDRLTRIESNDGRRIDLAYVGSSPNISSVTANPGSAEARTWTYSYATVTTERSTTEIVDWFTELTQEVLQTVTLPDGRQWVYDIDEMSVVADPGFECSQLDLTLSVTHPDGMTGTFLLSERSHRRFGIGGTHQAWCFGGGYDSVTQLQQVVGYSDSMSVVQKTLVGPGYPEAVWTYRYESDRRPDSVDTGGDYTNWTEVTDPNGNVTTYYHVWEAEPLGGKLVKRELREGSASGPLVEVVEYEYDQENWVGWQFVKWQSNTVTRPTHISKTTVTRGTDTYTTDNVYDLNQSSPTYSHGSPIEVLQYSSTSGGQSGGRHWFIDYAHDYDDWILGLVTQTRLGSKIYHEYSYDSKGRRTEDKLHGQSVATYTYHLSGDQKGLPHTITDALGRTTEVRDFKRGSPQTVIFPDNEQFTRVVDDNGWVESETDPLLRTFSYTYNTAGRLTGIIRPAGWDNTSITYTSGGPSESILQTVLTGDREQVTWYDAMLRPMTARTADTTNRSATEAYINRSFDAFGKTIKETWPAATSSTANPGVETTYDALDRVVETRETVAPFATESFTYFGGTQTSHLNAAGQLTLTTTEGYGSPNNSQVLRIDQPEGVITEMTYDIYGNMLTARQHGSYAGYSADVTQTYSYDNELRLCRHRTPEQGSTLFRYDAAGQKITEVRGQTDTAGCGSFDAGDAISFTYDVRGRLETTNYPGSTPDITRSYDAVGNLLTLNRGTSAWSYDYNIADLVMRETLAIDGRSYQVDYTYGSSMVAGDPSMDLTSRNAGYGAVLFSPDGLGRPTEARRSGGTAFASSIAYHRSGQLSGLTYGNGLDYAMTLNTRQLPESRLVMDGSTTILDLAYTYDALKRIEGVVSHEDSLDRMYFYDGLGRLKTALGPWGTEDYRYDPVGNLRYSYRSMGSAAPLDRTYAHDPRGNVTDNGAFTFVYDAANQPQSMSGTVNSSFVYDGHKRRVKQVIDGETIYSVYGYQGDLILRDNAATGELTEYIAAGGMTTARIKGSAVTYPHSDHLGTPVVATDASGAILWREAETPYGEPWLHAAVNDNDRGFTGHIEDTATGLTYMQARYYDPVIGQFLSTDPVQFSTGKPEFMGRYAYVGGDVVNLIDPFGLSGCGSRIKGVNNCFGMSGINFDRVQRGYAETGGNVAAYLGLNLSSSQTSAVGEEYTSKYWQQYNRAKRTKEPLGDTQGTSHEALASAAGQLAGLTAATGWEWRAVIYGPHGGIYAYATPGTAQRRTDVNGVTVRRLPGALFADIHSHDSGVSHGAGRGSFDAQVSRLGDRKYVIGSNHSLCRITPAGYRNCNSY